MMYVINMSNTMVRLSLILSAFIDVNMSYAWDDKVEPV